MRIGKPQLIALPPMALGFLLVCACDKGDARLADERLRDPKTQAVTQYDVELDESATPVQVAYVLLRAIRDDMNAETREQREAALDVQFDLSAAEYLKSLNRTSLDDLEFLFGMVNRWAPTLGHYAQQFDTDWKSAESSLVLQGPVEEVSSDATRSKAIVLREVADPAGDPNAGAVLAVWMIKERGFWRVTHVGFLSGVRTIAEQREKGMTNIMEKAMGN